jgi:hypothetical protein
MKSAVFFLGVLITISCVLLEKSDACYANRTWQTVGEMTVPDPSYCTTTGAQCRQEQVQISWDTTTNTFDWEYLPATCTACPATGSAPATCQQ